MMTLRAIPANSAKALDGKKGRPFSPPQSSRKPPASGRLFVERAATRWRLAATCAALGRTLLGVVHFGHLRGNGPSSAAGRSLASSKPCPVLTVGVCSADGRPPRLGEPADRCAERA